MSAYPSVFACPAKSNTTTPPPQGKNKKKKVKINNTQEKHCTEEVQQECI
jgi:hypothetical protein